MSLAHVCAAAVSGTAMDGAGVTVMVSPTVRETAYATDAVAAELEELQLTLGEGPCVDAFGGGGPALAADLRLPEFRRRWPAFGPAAMASGARAVFALPMQIGAIRLGAFDLYRATAGALTRNRLADALAYAESACLLLLDAQSAVPDTEEPDGGYPDTVEHPDAWGPAARYHDPTAHQAVVHQATGMMLVQLGTSADAAFARLRAYAFAKGRPLGQVARDVVDRRLRFHPDVAPTSEDTS